jgi:serine protease Do
VKELPGSEQLARNDAGQGSDMGTLNGVGVANLDAQARRQFGIPEKLTGAIVSEVQPDSAAAEAGLRPGDVIVEINRKAVKSADDAVAMTEKADNKRTLLRVWREGGSRFVIVDETKAG